MQGEQLMFTLATTANQIKDPVAIFVILAMAVVVVGYVLYSSFSAKPNPKARFQRKEKERKPASASGRFR
jgi:hypothetical protein